MIYLLFGALNFEFPVPVDGYLLMNDLKHTAPNRRQGSPEMHGTALTVPVLIASLCACLWLGGCAIDRTIVPVEPPPDLPPLEELNTR